MSRFGDERVHTHLAGNLHHPLEVGEVGLALGRVRVNEVGVNPEALNRQAGRAIGFGDGLATGGREVSQIRSSVVNPVPAVGLAQKKLHHS